MKLKIVSKLSDHGYPYHAKGYKTAHKEASASEKKRFPKGYEELKKKERSLDKHELMGKNTKSGKIEIEDKFKKYAKELSYHEMEEHKNLRRLEQRHKHKR
jgi:hypothetical protein